MLFFALSACDVQHSDNWKKRDDGSAPGLADVQDCHAEAQRQAEARYPPQRVMNGRLEMTFQNRDLFPAEISFFFRRKSPSSKNASVGRDLSARPNDTEGLAGRAVRRSRETCLSAGALTGKSAQPSREVAPWLIPLLPRRCVLTGVPT
ncbi:MAG: hypothetical protein J0H44_29205 [Alphaproteobacteria bacterium]|nr:hypothetical protein [Alphaproteobacteria bacterium]